MLDSIIPFILVGFGAQMVDGCLGMAYGVFSTTFLAFLGVPVTHASASVHFSELFTTLTSALSHLKLKNVDKVLFKRLILGGVIGGIIGAYILSEFDGDILRPFVCAYLLILGVRILVKSIRKVSAFKQTKWIAPLALVGGFFDAIGGGGWGPIVTSTLIARGNEPKKTIGSVNTAEFFVTVAESATFVLTIGLGYWNIIIGLIIGGCVAAPIAAYACTRMKTRLLMGFVGVLIIATNMFTLIKLFLK